MSKLYQVSHYKRGFSKVKIGNSTDINVFFFYADIRNDENNTVTLRNDDNEYNLDDVITGNK